MIDLRKPLKTLTDILGSHDLPLAFLFGAGASAAVKFNHPVLGLVPLFPVVSVLTADCRSAVLAEPSLGPKFDSAWAAIEGETITLLGRTDIEAILSRIRQKRDALYNTNIHGLTSAELEMLEDFVCRYISTTVSPPESKIPDGIAHDMFAGWIKALMRKRPIEIFTTNYDVLIERSLENLRVPLFDGFVGSYRPYFDATVFDRDSADLSNSWIRLWKIHGSVTWHIDDRHSKRSVYRGEVSDRGEMILPSHYKYDESRKMPYRAMQNRLGRVLDAPGTVLITCGYSFNDDHINETILTHSERSNATVFALNYGPLLNNSKALLLSANRPNFIVLGTDRGRHRGLLAPWSPESLDACASDPLLKALVPTAAGGAQVGDFNCFAQFLTLLSEGGPHAPTTS